MELESARASTIAARSKPSAGAAAAAQAAQSGKRATLPRSTSRIWPRAVATPVASVPSMLGRSASNCSHSEASGRNAVRGGRSMVTVRLARVRDGAPGSARFVGRCNQNQRPREAADFRCIAR